MLAVAHVHLVRLAAVIEMGIVVAVFATSIPAAVTNMRATRRAGPAYHIALGRLLRTLAIVLWGTALFLGMLAHWHDPVTWRYALYILGCPCAFVSWVLLDGFRWRDPT